MNRWGPDGSIDVLADERGEGAWAEPLDGVELAVGVFYGDDD